jgi:RNA polymerase sigma factor (sigma-70 family)
MNAATQIRYQAPVLAPPMTENGRSQDVQESRLSRLEEARLVRQAQAGDRRALERLVEAHIRLVYQVARRYRCRACSLEDLAQEGVVGLILAIERFDVSFNCRLSTYAMHWIRQAVSRAAELGDRLIYMPAQAAVEQRRILKLREERQRELGRVPDDEELARESGIPEERVQQLLSVEAEVVSLEALIGAERDAPLLEMAEDENAVNPEQGALSGMYQEQVRRLVAKLLPRERQVVEERYGFDGRTPRTLDDLSRQMRISRERVRQIEARAIRKLRHALRMTHWD